MTLKEIIKDLECLYIELINSKTSEERKSLKVYCDPVDEAIYELKKAKKYGWHDLRKDPTDLPTKRDWVLAVFKEPDSDFVLVPRVADYVGHETSATTEEFWLIIDIHTEDMNDYYKSLKCIAWKEEPFEVKE